MFVLRADAQSLREKKFMKLLCAGALLFSSSLFAQEVVKPSFNSKINLKIIRVMPESFDTYSLVNENGIEMTLVCADNTYYGKNKQAFIEYKNYYNERVGNFTFKNNSACLDFANFIKGAHAAVDEERFFQIELSKQEMQVKKITYPNVDEYITKGEQRDLLPKKEKRLFPQADMIYRP